MNIGDYIRTDIGEIRKVIRVTDDLYVLDKDVVFAHKDKIKKSSPNIIDLIEVGDYVNGAEVLFKHDNIIEVMIPSDMGTEDLHNKDIKSIVTKEQFEAMQYKVGE